MRVESKTEFQACIDKAPALKELSAERIKSELFKILASDMQLDVVTLMYNHGVLKVILPHVTSPECLRQLTWLETNAIKFDCVRPDPLRRLAALVETDGQGAAEITDALKLSNAEQQRLTSMIAPEWQADWQISDDDLRATLYQIGATTVIDLALLKWAEMLVASPTGLGEVQDSWVRIIEFADQAMSEPDIAFPLKGQDVLDQGVAPGPQVSDLLGQVEDWWLAEGCHADRNACLEKLEALL
jgi:poly(A) polymerase